MRDSAVFSFIAISIFIIGTCQIYAQQNTTNIKFDQITNESGRSLGFITGIEQDSTGFLWVTSRNGLNRYDGYSFAYFKQSKRSANYLPFNDITYSYYDRNKMMWLRHFDRLYLFDNQRISNRFDTILQNKLNHNTQVVQDIENNYWIGPHEQYLYRFNPNTYVIDTFICQTNLINPEIIKLIDKGSKKSLKLNPNNHKTNIDTAITVNIEASGYFIISAAGEGNKYKLFDYGTISKGKQTIWSVEYNKCNTHSASLFYCQVDMLFFEKGTYKMTFKSDEANSFNNNDIDSAKLSMYGIRITPVDDYKKTEKLFNKPYFSQTGLYGNTLYQLNLNKAGYPLLSTDKAIQEYNPKTGRFQIVENTHVSDAVRNYTNIPILETSEHKYVFAIENKLFVKNKNKTNHIDLPSVDLIICLTTDHENNLWIGTTNGIFIVDLKQSISEQNIIHIIPTNENRLYGNKIWSIFEDRSHNIWIGTDKGLNRFKKSKFNIIDINNERFSAQPILTDSKGNILLLTRTGKWVTIFNDRIKEIDLPKSIFKHELLTNEYIFDFNDIILLNDNTYIYATENKVGIFDKMGNSIKNCKINNLGNGAQNIIIRLVASKDGIWGASVDKLILFDNNLNIIKQIEHPKTYENHYEVSKNFINDIIWLDKSKLGVRTEMNIYTVDTDNFKINDLYQIPEANIGISSSSGNLAIDNNGCLWFMVFPQLICTKSNGELFITNIDIAEDIGNSHIIFLGNTMLIYSNNGLIRIDNYTEIVNSKIEQLTDEYYEFYSTREGLADNLITGIIPDKQNNIWVTTLKGLSYVDLKTGEIQNYFKDSDYISLGFPGNRISRHDTLRNTEILQTTNGILTFSPDSVNPFIPNVIINELLLFGKELETDTLIWNKKYLKLKFNQNFLTIGFTSLDYTQPTQNKYRYRLANLNDEWIYTDANNRKAPFAGIPPGLYQFIVQGSNNDGVWNNIGQTLIIEITPPWYKTIMAYIIYIFVIITGIILYIKIRERKLKEEKRILEQKVKERTHEIMMQKEEIQKQSNKIAEQHKHITDSIHYAKRIQTALLPSEEILKNSLPSYFILWRPRDIVSGDFFWITNQGDLTIAVAADCTGHGVPGAFMSMLGIAFLNELVNKDKIIETDIILNELRTNIIRSLKQTGEEGGSKDGMDISMCAINHKNLSARFSGAYNPLIIVRNGEYSEYKADKMPIGYHIKKDEKFSFQDIDLQFGDRLYMYSDGYVDQFGGADMRKFMSKKFKNLLVESRNLTMNEQKIHLNNTIEEWMGDHEQIDDILVFGIEITANKT